MSSFKMFVGMFFLFLFIYTHLLFWYICELLVYLVNLDQPDNFYWGQSIWFRIHQSPKDCPLWIDVSFSSFKICISFALLLLNVLFSCFAETYLNMSFLSPFFSAFLLSCFTFCSSFGCFNLHVCISTSSLSYYASFLMFSNTYMHLYIKWLT